MKKRFANRKIALLLALVMMTFTTFSGNTIAFAKTNKKVTSVTATSPKTLKMKIGDTYTIKTKVKPSNATNKKLTYKSSDTDIVEVSKKGKLTAVDAGTATITVKAVNGTGKKAKCSIKVVVAEEPSKTAQFTTQDNYHSLMYLGIELPDDISASDITSISFNVDTKSALSLRLYGGDGSVTKSDNSELTYEEKKLQDTVTGKDNVTENGSSVTKTKHDLTVNVTKSTRIAVAAGDKQKVTFTVDDHAKKVLSSVKGYTLALGIYAHNVAPAFSVSNVQITTSSKTYNIKIDEYNVDGLENGTVTTK